MSGTSDLIAQGFGSWSSVAKLPTLGFDIGAAITSHVVTIEGRCFTEEAKGFSVDSTRKILATITPGDAAVSYGFEETEVS
jgi:hypothetical protein